VSARVCAILRRDRGRLTAAVRLVGPRSDESWSPAGVASTTGAPPAPVAVGSAILSAEKDAAAWVAGRVGDQARIAAVCIDVDGALCAWMSAPTREARLVASLARSGPAQPEADAAFSTNRPASSALSAYAGSDLDASVQVLGGGVAIAEPAEPDATPAKGKKKTKSTAAEPPRAARVPVLAINDLPARLFVDGLDEQGVQVDRVLTLWHAAALAWDPGVGRAVALDAAILANAPTTAVVLVDPASSRLLWCWSVGGELLAGGSMRLARQRDSDSLALGEPEAARLATEWVAWSVQLGRTPSRCIAVCAANDDAVAMSDAPAAFGRELGAALSGCVVDMASHADPLGVTLTRLAEKLDDAPLSSAGAVPAGLATLASRPGVAHRRMHVWLSLAIIGAAAFLGAVAWRVGSNVGSARIEAVKQTDSWRELLKEVYPEALAAPFPFDKLRSQYDKREKELRPPEAKENARPILAELEALSFVLGNPDYELSTLQIPSGGQVIIEVRVKNVEQGEELRRSLDAVAGSEIVRWAESYINEGSGETARVKCRFSGTWAPRAPKPTPAASASTEATP